MVTAIHDQPCLVTIVVTKQTANTVDFMTYTHLNEASSKNIVEFFSAEIFHNG